MSATSLRGPFDVRRHRQGDAVLVTNRSWCKGCDLCISSCPVGILALGDDDRIEVQDISRCIFCGICAVRCPDFVFVLDRGSRESRCSD
jgi:Indolepyruvate ferredoxin oxidoreductase, alpha and beta subunits